MQNTDDEDINIEEEVDAFKSIIPPRPKNHLGGHGKIQLNQSAFILKAQCDKLRNQILDCTLNERVSKIFQSIVQNWDFSKSILIILNLKRNQKDDYVKIINKMAKIQRDKGNAEQKVYTVALQYIKKDDVRDIALQIQINQDKILEKASNSKPETLQDCEGRKIIPEKHLVIYIPKKITNLTQQNIHIFSKNVINSSFALILPTFEDFRINDGQGIIEDSEKYYFQAYNNKELFIQFFYRSIVSKNIMAYLPKEALNLIKMYDNYPISYQQGCNMLTHAIQLFNAKCQERGKPKKKLVQMKELIRVFNKSWKFDNREKCVVNRNNFQMLSKIILNQDAKYQVSELNIINYITLLKVKDSGFQDLCQKKVYQMFQKNLKDRLFADESLKGFVKILEQYDSNKMKQENFKIKNKSSVYRPHKLGFTPKDFQQQKKVFQDKITRFLSVASQNIRKQAQYIDWDDINIFKLMCPELIRETVEGIQQDPNFKAVFDMIRSRFTFPMACLIKNFKHLQIGKLVYILRCLELKGLIELNKNIVKPTLVTNFYERANFKMF